MTDNVNIFDIAKLAGVSTSTVSRVLNGHGDVSAKTRKRVQQAIDETSYIPNNSARSLSCISSHSVVVVASGVTNPFFSRMISIIQAELDKAKYTMILQNYDSLVEDDIVDTAISLYKEKRPKGMLFLGGDFEKSHQRLKQVDVPIVLATSTIHASVEREWFSSITIDDEGECANIASYICDNGHKRIGIIGTHGLRSKGFCNVLRERGIHFTEVELEFDNAFSYKAGYQAARKVLERGSYSCIFCFSDILAIGAIKAIHKEGLKVPEDISVIGFDGIEISEYVTPMITTAKQPTDEIAYKSVAALLDTIQNGKPPIHLVLPAVFTSGESFRPIK